MVLSKRQIRITLIVLFIVLFITAACAAPGSPSAIQPATSTLRPTETLDPNIIEPLVTSARLRFDSWSPDSQWIAYWFSDNDDVPVHLAFVNAQSGKVCQHEEVTTEDIFSGDLIWVEDNNATTIQNSGIAAFSGVPCETFSSVESPAAFEKEDGQISPDGRYSADTAISSWEEQLIHNVTTITEVSTKEIITTVKWDGSPHVWAESGWLNSELYLVGLDVNQGALYISVPDDKVGNVVSDLLGLDVKDMGYISHVGRHADAATGEYHLLIERSKESPLSLLLYHSELDLVEEIPFYRSWIIDGSSISPDGQWFFISYPSSKANDEITDFWIRSVDPPDSDALQLAEGMGFAGFSNEAQKIAFTDSKYVYILNFPNGEMLSQWGALGYEIDRVWWSPDGSRLTMQGFPTASQPDALFVVEP